MQTMYKAANSITVQLTADVETADQVLQVTDASVFPPAPNYVTIGTENNAEVIIYNGIDIAANKLTGCLRGKSGTAAAVWPAGSSVYHSWTSDNANAIMDNITDQAAALSAHAADTGLHTTAEKQQAWDDHAANTTVHITAQERSKWDAAKAQKHTHTNKSTLDAIDSTKVSSWDGKAEKAIEKTGVLNVSGWQGEAAPFTQAVAISGMTAAAKGFSGVAATASAEQRTAAAKAQLAVTAQGVNEITVSAFGTKPEVNIPIQVTIVG